MSINNKFNYLYGNYVFYFLNDKENYVKKKKVIHKIVKLDLEKSISGFTFVIVLRLCVTPWL